MSILPAPRTLMPEKGAVALAVFGTAPAAPLHSAHWWTAASRVIHLLKERFANPPRLDFLEDSLMEREMYRL
jgi:hypothetical protein